MKFLYLDRDDSKLGMTMSPAMKLYVIFGSYLERFFFIISTLSPPCLYHAIFVVKMSFVQTHKMCLNLFKQQFHARAELDRVCQQVFSEFQQKKKYKIY